MVLLQGSTDVFKGELPVEQPEHVPGACRLQTDIINTEWQATINRAAYRVTPVDLKEQANQIRLF